MRTSSQQQVGLSALDAFDGLRTVARLGHDLEVACQFRQWPNRPGSRAVVGNHESDHGALTPGTAV